MPKCHECKESVHAEDLRWVGDALACPGCRKLKGIVGEIPMAEENKTGQTESNKMVTALSIHEITREDGTKDHKISAQIGLGTLNMKWEARFDQIRDFFTKRREGAAKKKTNLTSV